MVADEHEPGPGPFDPDGEAEQVGIRGHGGLVEHHDGASVEDVAMVIQAPKQRPQRRGSDPGFLVEGAGGMPAGRCPEHPVGQG